MPTVNGVYTPISNVTAGLMYKQAQQIIRGQRGGETQGGKGVDYGHVEKRLTERYLRNGIVQPADRGRIRQIIRSAEAAHDAALAMNANNDRAVPLSGLGIDPTLSADDARVRYRAVVVVTGPDGLQSESLVLVDSDRVLGYADIQARAIEQAKAQDPMKTRGYNVEDFASPGLDYQVIVVGAGKRR